MTIRLANTASSSLWVNRRMGMGYEDSLERELYFTVYAADGASLPVPDEARVDVHRLAPKEEDFERLEPSGTVETAADLALWYPLGRAGRYRIVFTYENRWDGKAFGFEAFTGKVTAPPVSLDID